MNFRVRILAFFYFWSSSALLVLNKIAITVVPNASLLLFVQIASTVVIISIVAQLGQQKVVFFPSLSMIKAYSSVGLVFLVTIYSNFRLINAVGVNAFIVLRCTTPLIISILDWCFLGRELPKRRSLVALCGILLSGGAYVWPKILRRSDSGFRHSDAEGLIWSLVWLSSFIVDMVYIKYIVDAFPCNGLERSLYQNALSLPFLLVTLFTPLETSGLSALTAPGTGRAHLALVLSCIAGTVLSFTGMALRSELSATFFTVLGIVCKMASSFLNELFVEPENSLHSLTCILCCILSSSIYRQAPLRVARSEILPRASAPKM